ncbi:MAG TPA: VOC family protein [Acidimicrobiia bacterium]|nr:VOC family protein [Acidimicrobiia bacterium]
MARYVDPTLQLVTEVLVRDIRRSTDFYTSLGFELKRDGGDFVELGWGNSFLYLAEESAFPEGDQLAPPTAAPFPPGNVRVMVADVDACWKRAQEIGASVAVPIGDRYYGLRDFTIRDPDGFGLRFASFLSE